MSKMVAALGFDSHHGSWRPFPGDLPGQSRRLDLQNGSAPFGAGFTRIERTCQLAINLTGDQILYVISGELQITQSNTPTLVAHAGEAVMLRKGAQLSMGVVGHCHFFYVLAPDMDWRSALQPQ